MDASAGEALLAATLQRGPGGLTELLAGLAWPAETHVLLVIDQFEEIFRYYRQGGAEQAAAFVQLLLQSVNAGDSGVSVILTMCSDFLGDCAVFEDLPEAINQGLFLVPRLTRAQLRSAITAPAQVFGGQVMPALVNELLNDLVSYGEDTSDQLPVLQHALMRMWDLAVAENAPGASVVSPVLTLAHYQQIGGLQNALSNHADELLTGLSDRQQRVAALLFKSLTERGTGQRDIRRPVLLREVVALVAAAERLSSTAAIKEVIAVVEAFRATGRHFLTPSLDVTLQLDSILDIGYESFIRQWRLLQQWVSEEAEQAEQYQRLLDAALRHQQGKAGLWQTLELQGGLAWRDSFQPTAVWAQRYAGAQEAVGMFDVALAFLDEGHAAQLKGVLPLNSVLNRLQPQTGQPSARTASSVLSSVTTPAN